MLPLVLVLALVGCSLQRGVKPQQSAGGNPQYPSEYVRGAGAPPQGIPGPLGAKAGGKYPQYPAQGYQQGPAGLRNGYGGLGVKPKKSGLGQFAQPAKQKPGYGNGNYPGNLLAQGLGTKKSKPGYGAGGYPNIAAQGGYGNGAAGYPSNLPQQGYAGKPPKPGYGAGSYPQYGAQAPGYGAGSYPQYGAQAAGYGAGSYPQYGAQAPGYGAGSYPQYGAQAGGYGAGNYPQIGDQAAGSYPQIGAQAGYGNGAGQYPGNLQKQGYGAKPSKAGYGAGGYPNIAQGGYKNGNVGYPNNLQQQQGIAGKAGKAGYGNGAGILPSSAGLQGGIGKPSKAGIGYPSNIYPQGLGAKTSKAGPYKQPYSNGLSNFQGNGKGIKSPLNANLGPAGESSKLGAYGQLPYRSQSLAADALGYDAKSVKAGGVKSPYGAQAGYPDAASSKYAGESQTPYIAQSVPQSALEEEIAPSASVEGTQSIREGTTAPPITPSPPGALTQGPLKGGYQQLGAGQGPWTYAPEESAYGQNGYYANGYRGCAGKC